MPLLVSVPGEGAEVAVVSAEEQRDDLLARALQLTLARVELLARVHQVVVVVEVEVVDQLLQKNTIDAKRSRYMPITQGDVPVSAP